MTVWKSLFLTACIGIGCYIGFMLIDNAQPYEWDADQSYVLPNPAGDGSRVTVNWKMKVNRVCPATSERVMRDTSTRKYDAEGRRIPYSGEIVVTYDTTPAAKVQMNDDRLIRTFVLSRGLPPTVDYSSRVCFSCNPLQRIWPNCFDTPELTFSIVPNDAPTFETFKK